MIIGVTGRIATGKTTAAKILGEKGFLRVDADAIYDELRKNNKTMMGEIKARFGSSDRAVLLSKVRDDRKALQSLNDITHKYVVHEIRTTLREENYKNAVLDVPIPVEEGFLDVVDFVIVTDCKVQCQVHRIIARDGISPEKASEKVKMQMPAKDYCALGDLVIDTTDMNSVELEKIINIVLDL